MKKLKKTSKPLYTLDFYISSKFKKFIRKLGRNNKEKLDTTEFEINNAICCLYEYEQLYKDEFFNPKKKTVKL
jgi:hypothetical protein